MRPACVHTEKEIDLHDGSLLVAGWGKTEHLADKGNARLKKAGVELFSHEACSEVYEKGSRKLERGIVEDLQVCAGSKVDVNDTCQVDTSSFDYFQIHVVFSSVFVFELTL